MRTILFLSMSLAFSTPLWSQFGPSPVTRDGHYVRAMVGKTLVVQSTTNSWKKEIPGATGGEFTPDDTRMLFMIGDTLCLWTLGTDTRVSLPTVASYKQPAMGTGQWLAYQRKGADRTVVLRNLSNGQEQSFPDVAEYAFDARGQVLLLKVHPNAAAAPTALQWVQVADGKATQIWSHPTATLVSYALDAESTQLVLLVQEKAADRPRQAIWYYKAGTPAAVLLANDATPGIDSGLVIGDAPPRFSPRGGRILFYLKEKALPTPDPAMVKLDVWSYTDPKLQPQQQKDWDVIRTYAAAISPPEARVVRLEREQEFILGSSENGIGSHGRAGGEVQEGYALVAHFPGEIVTYSDKQGGFVEIYAMNEYNWNRATRSRVELVSTADGSRKILQDTIRATSSRFPFFRFSPGGRYIVSYDQARKHYMSYEIATGITRDITPGIPVSLAEEDPEGAPRGFHAPRGILAWLEQDAALLVLDRYSDLWRLDPSGARPPLSLTKGYARQHQLRLYPADNAKRPLRDDESVLFSAIASRYRTGYYEVRVNAAGNPRALVPLGNAYKYRIEHKAENRAVYVVTRQSTTEPSRPFYTSDFTTWTPIGTPPISPVGLQQELVVWKTFDGTESQGVLVKPADFDPKKKYPVIFYYYEKGDYNQFEAHNEFVDAGYLLFKPDIHYTVGQTGPSTYNSVVSAAKFLAQRPYVDAAHMGIYGVSFGGYETNYLVTHSQLFAAACSSSGHSNFLSYYGTPNNDGQGYSYTGGTERGQLRIGASPWQRPDLYVRNSPIFTADQVTTPLLLLADKLDYRVPFEQGVELFMALRRMGKRAWLLQYDGDGHSGGGRDFATRYQQFFAHYLKGAPAPKWMLDGIPARRKGLETGLELDTFGRTPGPGLTMTQDTAVVPGQKRVVKQP